MAQLLKHPALLLTGGATKLFGMSNSGRPTIAEVDLGAFRHNVSSFVGLVRPSIVCAVVKADGYGHGAVPCATAAIAGGARWLAVALVEEAIELRGAGISAPILLLSEFPDGAERDVVGHGITPTVYSFRKIRALADVPTGSDTVRVHIKVDTGMHRVGAQPHEVLPLAREVQGRASLEIGGVFTHLAVADDPADLYTGIQLRRFNAVVDELRSAGVDPGLVHAANSAGALAHPMARFDLVRVGIALYGNDPDPTLPASAYGVTLRPVLRLSSRVSHVKVLAAGERASYGLRYTFQRESVVATVPIGYADGLSRRYSSVGGEVLLHGRRRPIAGRVTMDQILIDCGAPDPSRPVNPGDEVVLLGDQRDQRITPWEMAARLETIAYETTCAISRRVPRSYVGTDPEIEL